MHKMLPLKRQMFQATGDIDLSGLNATITNPATGATSNSGTSLNQEYNNQVASGAFIGSFSDFMKHLSVNSVIDSGYSVVDSVRKLFAKSSGQVITEPTVVAAPARSGQDMTKWFVGLGVAVVVVVIAVKVYKHYRQ